MRKMLLKELKKRRGQTGLGSLPLVLQVGMAAFLLIVVAVLLFGILGSSTVTSAVTLQNQSALTNATQSATNQFTTFVGLIALAITVLVLVVVIGVLMQIANIGRGG